MSLTKILEKYHKSVKELAATFGEFIETATDINSCLKEYKTKFDAIGKANNQMSDYMLDLAGRSEALKTDGIAQLQDVKKLLVLASRHPHGPHPIKASEIKELADHQDASDPDWAAFVKEAKAINAKLAEHEVRKLAIGKAYAEWENNWVKAQRAANSLKTHGIVQLEEVKKLLVIASENYKDPKPIKLDEIAGLHKQAEILIETKCNQKLQAYLTQHAGSWPADIKPGMVFRNKRTLDLIEITTSTDIDKAQREPGFKGKFLKDPSGTPSTGMITGGSLTPKTWVFVNVA